MYMLVVTTNTSTKKHTCSANFRFNADSLIDHWPPKS